MPRSSPASVGPAWATLAVALALIGCATSEPIRFELLNLEDDAGGSAEGGAPDGGAAEGGASAGGGGAPSDGGDPNGGLGGAGCGDGLVQLGELCDDGNGLPGDGCDACSIECAADSIAHPVTGHCYRLFTGDGNQPSAEANCEAWGGALGLGHLASFADLAENDFVAPLVAGDTWIGADDFGGSFSWIDSTPFGFENWQTNEPNHPGTEHCMFMDVAAKWHDHNCGDLRPAYLCERRGAGTF